MKQLIIDPKPQSDDCLYYLLDWETGEVLASHYCSHSSYAKGDLVLNRPERMKKYTEKYGEFEVKFIDDFMNIDEFVDRNKEFYKDEIAKEAENADPQ